MLDQLKDLDREKLELMTCCQATLPDSHAVTGVSQGRLTPHLGFFNRPQIDGGR